MHIEIGPRSLLDRSSFVVGRKDKIGLVGRNGAGKTTLMTVLSGEAAATVAHSGTVQRRGKTTYVPQVRFIGTTEREISPMTYILGAQRLDQASDRMDRSLATLEAKPSMHNIERFTDAEEAFRMSGGYQAEPEIRRICVSLGLPSDRLERPLATLSGGERRRVELARALFASSDTLLLDEPSNHLDNDAKLWLMNFLAGYSGALVIVSHDLHLLDASITRVLHLESGILHVYKGTYSEYIDARKAEIERTGRQTRTHDKLVSRLQSRADSMRHSTARRARTAKSLDRRIERLQALRPESVSEDRRVSFRLPEPPHSGKLVLRARGLTKAFDRDLFQDVSCELQKGDRLSVIGLNGAGKTTFLRILAGAVESDSGEVETGVGVRIGYYAQEHEDLAPGTRPIDIVRDGGIHTDEQVRSLLGMFTLGGDIVFQDSATLSGGEKTKLSLARLVAGACNLLMLDEPTNNLDPASRDAIGDAMATWTGTLILVSHDEEFVTRIAPTHALIMPEGDFQPWSTDLLEIVPLA